MKIVAVDEGHSIEDQGNKSPDGSFFEWEFTRDVGRRLAKLLVDHGVKVINTSQQDTEVSLQERCDIANRAGADIFVSLHANAFGQGWTLAHGWEIFHAPESVEGNALAKSIAKYSTPLGLTMRGVKTANFYVLKNTIMPAVLIEHFFFTNQEELSKCNTHEFRQKFAIADAKGILEYLGLPLVGDTPVVDTVFESMINILRIKLRLEEDTVNYLRGYKYGKELVKRIVENLK
jgi:N-acetylmuramoyl-L-alanine amidase